MGKRKMGRRSGSLMLDALFYDDRVIDLSRPSLILLFELNQQYNSFNNGNLSATPKTLRLNWNERTLKRARKELLAAELIKVTRPGLKGKPTLYALCHVPVNEIVKHNIAEERFASVRANGKRKYFYPVRVSIEQRQKNIAAALRRAKSQVSVVEPNRIECAVKIMG